MKTNTRKPNKAKLRVLFITCFFQYRHDLQMHYRIHIVSATSWSVRAVVKGLKIAFVPLNLQHVTVFRNILNLSCWEDCIS